MVKGELRMGFSDPYQIPRRPVYSGGISDAEDLFLKELAERKSLSYMGALLEIAGGNT